MMKEETAKIQRRCTACGKLTEYGRKDKPITCPFCHDKYWDKPKDERDLFILQDKYVASGRDNKILGLIYEKLVDYSENIVKKSLIRSGKRLQKEVLDEKSESIAIKLIERYLKSPDALVQSSFGGMLNLISRGVLYSEKVKKADRESSLDMQLDESFTMIENPAFFITDPIAKRKFENKYELDAHDELVKSSFNSLSSELTLMISKMDNIIRDSQGSEKSIYFLIGLNNFLNHNNTGTMEQYYAYCSNKDRQNIENAKMVLRSYLFDRMRTE